MTVAHGTSDDAAGVPAPSSLEVLLTRAMLHGVMSGSYRGYVVSMGLRGDERVLDYGSGSGAAARHLVKVLDAGGGRLTCLDISPAWQRALRKTLDGHDVDYQLGDVRTLELESSSFDAVVMHWMFHDVPEADRREILARLAALLRPGGKLFTREPTRREEGIPAGTLRGLLQGAGLRELRGYQGSAFMMGPFYSGVWEKPE